MRDTKEERGVMCVYGWCVDGKRDMAGKMGMWVVVQIISSCGSNIFFGLRILHVYTTTTNFCGVLIYCLADLHLKFNVLIRHVYF